MSEFATHTINYLPPTDDNFQLRVGYDLTFLNSVFQVDVKIKLVGDDPGSASALWENAIESIWNDRVLFNDGARFYEIKFNVDFVSSGEHHTVTVHDTAGRSDEGNWYTGDPGGGTSWQDEMAAHEYG